MELAVLKATVEQVRQKYAFSERRACRVMGIAASSYRYESRRTDEAAAREAGGVGARKAAFRESAAAATEWRTGEPQAIAWDLSRSGTDDSEEETRAPNCCLYKSGYRSSIACSLLHRAGFKNVTNVVGAFDAWRRAGLPTVTEETIAA